MGVISKVVLLILLAYLAKHTVKVICITGIFVNRHNHQPGPCRAIPGIGKESIILGTAGSGQIYTVYSVLEQLVIAAPKDKKYGSEDIQTLPNGVALISAGWQTIGAKASNDLRGFYMFDFNHPDRNVTKLSIRGSLQIEDFTPHGFSLWTDPDTGIITLFVINHGPTQLNNESVEVFTFDEAMKSLQHIRTIKDNRFIRLNDLVLASNETFYATNDCQWFLHPLKWNIETCLQTPLGNVVFYDGHRATEVAGGYVLPNGINISPDHRFVYVILCGEAQMSVLQKHSDNSLTEVKRVDLFMSRPDNIDVQSNGELWIAGSYKLFYDKQMSTMIIRGNEIDGEFKFSEVYVNDGSDVSWASVANFYGNELLIGTPEANLLHCTVKT